MANVSNMIRRNQIAELYNRCREFRADKLSPVLNPDLLEACRSIPELDQFSKELDRMLLDFERDLIKFADDKFPMSG
jgi:hypothetical protein